MAALELALSPEPALSARTGPPADPRPPRSARTRIRALQVVLKVAERCNINCTYCYYFNGGDEQALSKPAVIARDTLAQVAAYLAQGVRDLGIPVLYVSFHGGEPLMMKPELFDYACEIIRERVGGAAKVGFIVQTNGTIWNDRFAEVFRKHEVSVGVSLDGGRAHNDRFRLDHRGKSTYDRIVGKLDAMRRTGFGTGGRPISCISVLDSRNDYAQVYAKLRSMGFEALNFLLPDRSHDPARADDDSAADGDAGARAASTGNAAGASSDQHAADYGDALSAIAMLYFAEDDVAISVRQLDAVLRHFQAIRTADAAPRDARRHREPAHQESLHQESLHHEPPHDEPPHHETPHDESPHNAGESVDYEIMVIHSDGAVALNDSYMPALAWWKAAPTLHVAHSTVRDYVDLPVIAELSRALAVLPAVCGECQWRGVCRGGDAENRFSSRNGFDNPSVYCGALKRFYATVTACLLAGGYPEDALRAVLTDTAAAADALSAAMRGGA